MASSAPYAVRQPTPKVKLTSSHSNNIQQPFAYAPKQACLTIGRSGCVRDQGSSRSDKFARLMPLNQRSCGTLTKTAFCGRGFFIPVEKGVSRANQGPRIGNKEIGRKSLTQANAADAHGIHLDARGLVVLEEETTLTQQEWEEAKKTVRRKKSMEQWVERMIFNCRFFTLAGVAGSLLGSLLCFLKGSYYVVKALQGYVALMLTNDHTGKVVMKLIEALDTYLVGTVMLIFGMGLYELFVMKLDAPAEADHHSSSLFGLFHLQERPMWLAINGLDDLKTKLGHVIVMILLVGMFEKSKKVHPTNSMDLFLTAGSVLMCAGSLFLLNRLKH